MRKTSKAAMRESIDSFLYRHDWLTGGTREEVARQVAGSVAGLQRMADDVARLFANPSKLLLEDRHLCEFAGRIVPETMARYRARLSVE